MKDLKSPDLMRNAKSVAALRFAGPLSRVEIHKRTKHFDFPVKTADKSRRNIIALR
ncbi:hypothetical protein [Phaeobacter sp. J2-8]|uniref:hypothetical protein n=1 Tax=Phaeobacter sp. J2-8 TaxID=2931394 RepID=UPI001FD07169|nr:hypothetical protein [Phaeobacter sp. J2-8]MCJ7874651.1 hypothetical protein [Phaeobacter sp. J2-8]